MRGKVLRRGKKVSHIETQKDGSGEKEDTRGWEMAVDFHRPETLFWFIQARLTPSYLVEESLEDAGGFDRQRARDSDLFFQYYCRRRGEKRERGETGGLLRLKWQQRAPTQLQLWEQKTFQWSVNGFWWNCLEIWLQLPSIQHMPGSYEKTLTHFFKEYLQWNNNMHSHIPP